MDDAGLPLFGGLGGLGRDVFRLGGTNGLDQEDWISIGRIGGRIDGDPTRWQGAARRLANFEALTRHPRCTNRTGGSTEQKDVGYELKCHAGKVWITQIDFDHVGCQTRL